MLTFPTQVLREILIKTPTSHPGYKDLVLMVAILQELENAFIRCQEMAKDFSTPTFVEWGKSLESQPDWAKELKDMVQQ